MKSIKELIGNLEREEHLQMMHAFDNGLPEFIEYKSGFFLGVHINPLMYPKLKIIEERGKWCQGIIENEPS